mmetsp:Transcript_29381/g.90039  ORF Transcript_29381/g.90039 Transcript_29381/m.90039 type:complete len:243 (+) Transcript_29381:217-945(+)
MGLVVGLLLLLLSATGVPAVRLGRAARHHPPSRTSRAQLLATATGVQREGAAALSPAPPVYFIMGGPGSGKGTQCARLIERFDATHLSAGDLLRAEVASGSDAGEAIAKVIAEGKIVASSTTVKLLHAAMAKGKGPFLIDGFPRSLDNLKAFERELPPCVFMLFLDVSEEVMLERLLIRGESSGRSDDNEQTIRKRFRTYLEESMPVVHELERRGLVRRISAEASPDEVFEQVCAAFADQDL